MGLQSLDSRHAQIVKEFTISPYLHVVRGVGTHTFTPPPMPSQKGANECPFIDIQPKKVEQFIIQVTAQVHKLMFALSTCECTVAKARISKTCEIN